MKVNYQQLWERCYEVSLPTKKEKEIRLKELTTWDDNAKNEEERQGKIKALQILIKKQ